MFVPFVLLFGPRRLASGTEGEMYSLYDKHIVNTTSRYSNCGYSHDFFVMRSRNWLALG